MTTQDWTTALVALMESSEVFISRRNIARIMSALCKRTRDVVAKLTPGLLPHQRGHVYSLLSTLRTYRRCLDTSVMGAGKTYTTLYVAKKLNKKVVVFGPTMTDVGWQEAVKWSGLSPDDVEFFPYSVCQRKVVPYINCIVDQDRTKHYSANSQWRQKAKNGVLLVLDESQNLKNKTDRTDCAVALCKAVMNEKNSALLCLSATPFDKVEHTVNLMRVMGVVQAERLATMNIGTRELILEGLLELINYCRYVNPNVLVRYNHYKPAHAIAHSLVVDYIKPKLFHSMVPPPKEHKSDLCNYFANIDEEGRVLVAEGVASLVKAYGLLSSLNAEQRAIGTGMMSKALETIERGKATTFIRLATAKLMNDLTSKVVIMVNYTEPLEIIKAHLAWARPLIINGPVKQEDRLKALRLFQSKSLTHRLLISNTGITSTGVNLDDRYGDRPRLMLISPSYKTITLHQASGRIDRATTKSRPTVKYVYIAKVATEVRILDTLARKSSCIKSTLKDTVAFPGDHVVEYESPVER